MPYKKLIVPLFILALLLLTFCAPPQQRPTELPPSTSMWPTATRIAASERATIIIGLDMGNGGAGFSATLYAQEVTTGKTFHTFLSAGMHGASTLPTAAPQTLDVLAPGTYVFYARLTNAPDEYHYGATGCPPATACDDHILIAIDVQPGQTYTVSISDSKAELPPRDQPVTVPWRRE